VGLLLHRDRHLGQGDTSVVREETRTAKMAAKRNVLRTGNTSLNLNPVLVIHRETFFANEIEGGNKP
jgi:hypothetical protein